MSLKAKTLVIFLLTLIVFSFIQEVLHQTVILPGICELEDMEAGKNSLRPQQALKREFYYLSALAYDWSTWDNTYQYLESRSKAYEKANIVPETTFQINHIHLITVVDKTGQPVWSKIITPETGEEIPWTEILGHRPWKNNADIIRSDFHDIVQTSYGPLMLVSRPIFPSPNQGASPPEGLFLVGRFLDRTIIQRLVDQTGVFFELIPAATIDESSEEKGLWNVIQGVTPILIKKKDGQTLSTYTLPKDIQQKPVYLLKTTQPRDLYQKGLNSMRFSLVSILFFGALMVFPALVLLHIIVLKPIWMLSKHVQSVEESGNLALRLNLKRKDEIGILARRFDNLMGKLSAIRSYLLEQSYLSGLSGMSSDIIHHGINTLMPLVHKTDTVKNNFMSLPMENIHKAMNELEGNGVPPERQKNLNRFLVLSAGEMLKTIQHSERLLDDISNHGKEMEILFRDLEQHSRSKKVSSTIALSDVVGQALSQIPEHFRESCAIHVDPGLSQLPDVTMESQVIMHVLNAILTHSIAFAAQRKDDQGEIRIMAHMVNTLSKDRIRFIVENNGPVQDMDNIKEMFTRVYAEKNRLPFCSGLHWCSNVVRAMRGELDVAKENGKTVFYLTLPTGGME